MDGLHRLFPITPNNIRIGWVLASRLARVRVDQPLRREAIALDNAWVCCPATPTGLLSAPVISNGSSSAASGTQELLVFKQAGLPWVDYGGPGDHIDPALLKDKDRFYRIPLGGRPMALRYSKDGKHVFVANYLGNSVQVVDVPGRKVVRTINLGGPNTPSLGAPGRSDLLRQQAKARSTQWYSCHTCHYEGHVEFREHGYAQRRQQRHVQDRP